MMSLMKIPRFINKRCLLNVHSKHLSTSKSSGDKGKDGGSDNKDSTNQTPTGCPCEPDDNPSAPTMYDCRKYGHNLPCDSVAPYFEPLPYIPTGIFRCTYGEMLGRGANKCGYYKNPEYFSYQHMTFYDMHLILRPCRQPSPKTGRKP